MQLFTSFPGKITCQTALNYSTNLQIFGSQKCKSMNFSGLQNFAFAKGKIEMFIGESLNGSMLKIKSLFMFEK